MKMLTYSRMAAARLRANKRGYASLALGIFLSIFLISCMAFGAYGFYLAQLQVGYEKVGYGDMVILDNASFGDEEIQALNQYDRIGHSYILGQTQNANLYVGYYDEIAEELMNLTPLSGRLPDGTGEVAMEKSAMDVLEEEWNLGDTIELDICGIDGEAEKRTYTLVGILPERSTNLEVKDHDGITSFPAIVTSRDEPAFSVGRVGINYVLDRKNSVSQSETLKTMWTAWQNRGFSFYAFTTDGEQLQFVTSLVSQGLSSELFDLLLMAECLVAALVLSCAVGISSAMEGLLIKRQEEIGVLRALGSTRRQIRRMFGRENLLLAAILAPASIAVSIGAVWIASQLFPSDIKFGFHIGLLLPILGFSVIVILLAGYLPLVRASKLMPMSVIRDTAMLRKSKRVKSRKIFSAPRLISSRQVRFHLNRQIGASMLVGLMLMCSSMLFMLVASYRNVTYTEQEGFILRESGSYTSAGFEPKVYEEEPISDRSLAQLRSLDHVKSLQINRMMAVTAVLDAVPRYAIVTDDFQVGVLNESMMEETKELYNYSDDFVENWRQEREAYLARLKEQKIDGEAYGMYIITTNLTEETVRELESTLESGKINVDAINAGQEVLVVAPEVWIYSHGNGGYTSFKSQEAAENAGYPDAKLLAWNNTFSAGQSLPLLQLYSMKDTGKITCNDETVTVGGVLSISELKNSWIYNDCYILTTEQGLKNMNLRADGIHSIYVYLEGDVTLEEEETLEQQITAITRRSGAWSVSNEVKNYREYRQEDQQQIFLFLSITTVFFAVAVGMIVSSVTRQLQSEGRTIGMLRAVGADEKAILGCYSGSMRASVIGGLAISVMLFLLYYGIYFLQALQFRDRITANDFLILAELIGCSFIMALLCYGACRLLLRKRIREIMNRSIIENIKEL